MAVIVPTSSDIFKIEPLIREAAKEGPFGDLSYNREKVLIGLYEIILDTDQCIFLYEYKDKFIGIFLGYITEWSTSSEKVAQDRTWFILPEYRHKTIAAIKLLKSFEKWAINKNVTSICPGSMTGGNIEYVRKLYEKLGYTTIGYNFKKGV